MIPSAANSDYPVFVADQVLTSDNLNDLFGYLDEQERMTRTNLTGMGIVCGLQVKTAADGTSITITKGVGVTGSGYLVSVPEIEYTKRTTDVFDAVKCTYYDKFVDESTTTQRFDLWELKQDAEAQGTTDLTSSFLNDGNKIVLIFVELLEANNKNCDPNSCDDKGVNVTVTFRVLLASKANVDTFLSNTSNNTITGNAVLLPEIKMPRYDVPSTLLLDSEDVFDAYQKILTQNFIASVNTTLSASYTKLNSLLVDDLPADPFDPANTSKALDKKFSFLYDGSITDVQVLNVQYFYDFFSDLILAYDELRKKAFDVVCECLPDESLFPRHLLLGEAIGFDEMNSLYRTRFISSPVLCCCGDNANSVRSLFKRLVLMVDNLSIPGTDNNSFNQKSNAIKATPSFLGREPLSEKAIPFYYKTNDGTDPLYLSWNNERTQTNTSNQILSYNAPDYATDDFVINPLKYDLEPYNFLRIEGHIGRDYRSVLTEMETLKRGNRLPFDVVALSSDTRSIFSIIEALTTMNTTGSIAAAFEEMVKHPCCFSDIFLALDEWINKLRCCLAEQMRYYLAQPSFEANMVAPKEMIFRTNSFAGDREFTIEENTIGHSYQLRKEAGTINNQFCSDVFVNIATNNAQPGAALIMMPYKIDQMTDVLPEHITQLDAKELESRYSDLTGTASQLRKLYSTPNVAGTMTGVDLNQLNSRLEMNCLICLFLELRLLIREFLIRLLGLMIRQKLGYYAYTNAGIQHKAGVPMGGTFIIVYHEQSDQTSTSIKSGFSGSLKSVNTFGGTSSSSFYSGTQPMLSSALLLDEIMFLQKVADTPDDPNQLLDPILETLKAGTVIADFYVPYICCSDCPPAQILVLPAPEEENKPPVADAGPDKTITLPETTSSLEGSVTDPEGQPLTFAWTLTSGQTGVNITSANTDGSHINVSGLSTAGIYTFQLIAKDEKGLASAPDTATITVIAENKPPTADAGDDKTITLPLTTSSLEGSGTDPEGNPLTFAWTFLTGPAGGNPNITNANADGSHANVSGLTVAGIYTFQLIAKDDKGLASAPDNATITVIAANKAPVADAGLDKTVILPQTTSSLEGAGVDPEGKPLTFKWILTSGQTSVTMSNANADGSHINVFGLITPGTYVFQLTVIDDQGLVSPPDTATITVTAENKPPVVDAGVDKTITLPQTTSSLEGSGVDPEGKPLAFQWTLTSGQAGVNVSNANADGSHINISGLTTAGIYVFQLTATDEKGLASAPDTASIIVKPPVVQRICADLTDIIKQFNTLGGVDTPANFKKFTDTYVDFKEIQNFYQEMQDKGIPVQPIDKQIEFFAFKKINDRLVVWINDLRVIIQQQFDLRLLALTMLNIHAQLIYYIACIQEEDVDKAKVPMLQPLSVLLELLSAIRQFVPNFTQQQKDVLKKLLSITQGELARVHNNGEDAKKPVYVSMLKRIIEIISAMPL